MRRRERVLRTMEAIMKEIADFGKFKIRKGSAVYDEAVATLSRYKIIMRSRRERPGYWYAGRNYREVKKVGLKEYMGYPQKESKKEEYRFGRVSSKIFFLFLGIFIGLLLYALLMWYF